MITKKVPATTVTDQDKAQCAYNVKKSIFQSAAESLAKHFNDDYVKKLKKP